jgi:hypothetical protein
MKDRLGEQDRGSEWELIKKISKEMETTTRWTRLPKHVSDSTTQVCQDHTATKVLLVLGTNNHLHPLENAVEQETQSPLHCTGHTSEQHQSDRSLLAISENFHRRPLHRSGQCSSPVRPVQAKKSQIHQIDLPSPKTDHTRNSSDTGQQGPHKDVHSSKTQQRVCTC